MSLPEPHDALDLAANNTAAEEALRRLVDALLDLANEIQELIIDHTDDDRAAA